MLILDATTKSLTGVLGESATTQPTFVATWADATDTALTEGATDGVFNSTTPVTLLAAPGSGTRRVLRNLTIHNPDSVSHVVIVRYVSAGGTRQIFRITLGAGGTWELDGFQTRASNPFDQDLNTTDSPAFADLTLTGTLVLPTDGTVIESADIDTLDGYRISKVQDYLGTGLDALLIAKVDANNAVVDGALAFGMTGSGGTFVPSLTLLGDGSVVINEGPLVFPDLTEQTTAATAGGGGGGVNLVRNWAFDWRPGGTAAVPLGWVLEGTPTVAYDTAPAGFGSAAVKLTGTGAANEGISQTVKLRASTSYRLHAIVKATSGDQINLVTTGGSVNVSANSTATGWTVISGTVTTDATPTDVVIKITANADTDIVWCGAVWLIEGTSDSPPSAGTGYAVISLPAGEWSYPAASAIGELDYDTGSNGGIDRQLLAVADYLQRTALSVPWELDPAGIVGARAVGYSVTAASGKNVKLRLYQCPLAAGESWDAAYVALNFGDQAVNATQDYLDGLFTSATVATLGWTGGDQLRLQMMRVAADSNELSGAWGLTNLELYLPVR